mgnify:CR=1 FL=1|tara:strand:+ start:333 stop:719 length:387 start_codon:yes stop_codon:yes gene_type:complete
MSINYFKIIVVWGNQVSMKETILDSSKFPDDERRETLEEVYNIYRRNITDNFNTSKKCLDYMLRKNIGPFKYNKNDCVFVIYSIDIVWSSHHHKLDIARENENFILNFNKYFEIIKDQDCFNWRFTEL